MFGRWVLSYFKDNSRLSYEEYVEREAKVIEEAVQ